MGLMFLNSFGLMALSFLFRTILAPLGGFIFFTALFLFAGSRKARRM